MLEKVNTGSLDRNRAAEQYAAIYKDNNPKSITNRAVTTTPLPSSQQKKNLSQNPKASSNIQPKPSTSQINLVKSSSSAGIAARNSQPSIFEDNPIQWPIAAKKKKQREKLNSSERMSHAEMLEAASNWNSSINSQVTPHDVSSSSSDEEESVAETEEASSYNMNQIFWNKFTDLLSKLLPSIIEFLKSTQQPCLQMLSQFLSSVQNLL